MLRALPAGVIAWLEDGINVCGSEHLIAVFAQRFPRSRFVGVDGMQATTFDLVVMTSVPHDIPAFRRALRPNGILLCFATGLQAERLATFAREAGLSIKVLDADVYAVHV